ncbi:MAG: 3-deoxy-D-manno-octulosonic acid transferase [Verrucomicrobiota bacterium]|nr:3-deoxy-D-manno-octulosonic acid transferase [Verrucomicrobiota bacterium]
MIRLLYNLLFPFALLFFLPGYLRKARRRGGYRPHFGQRFGIYGRELRARLAANPHTWIHAVSVGEVAIALKLASKLRELDPQFRCLLSTTTSTGYAVAEGEASDWLAVMYHPLDFWLIVRRAFAVVRPPCLILVEAEVWPNLTAEARNRAVPVALVNARLSPRSERRFRRFLPLVRPTFRALNLVCVQEPGDAARWHALGVCRETIRHTGSIKYDPSEGASDASVPSQVLDSLGVDRSRPILLGGSTHPGEEEILSRAFVEVRKHVPDLLLIVAPRHVERTDEIASTLIALGLDVARRSAATQPDQRPFDVIILDSTGELRHWYAVATIVFIGKSLAAHGGQNPVEPILARKPVVFGPHMENFATLARTLLEHRGAIEVQNESELEQCFLTLIQDPAQRAALVRQALEVLAPHRGATQRTAELLLTLKTRR